MLKEEPLLHIIVINVAIRIGLFWTNNPWIISSPPVVQDCNLLPIQSNPLREAFRHSNLLVKLLLQE
jgi:hypothetical protein